MAKSKSSGTGALTTKAVAARVQSAIARAHQGMVSAGSQAARMQSAASRNAAKSKGN